MERSEDSGDELDTEHIRAALVSRRAELLQRIAEFGANDPAETSNLNFGKRIGDGTTYAVERMTGAYQASTLYETVREIDTALELLEAGTYGRCTACGQRIPEERLAALPWLSVALRRSESGCAWGRRLFLA